MKIKLSKVQWETMGKNAGWMKKEAGLGQGLQNAWQGLGRSPSVLQDFKAGLGGEKRTYGQPTVATNSPFDTQNLSANNTPPEKVLELMKQLEAALPKGWSNGGMIKSYEQMVANLKQQQPQQAQQPQQQPQQQAVQ